MHLLLKNLCSYGNHGAKIKSQSSSSASLVTACLDLLLAHFKFLADCKGVTVKIRVVLFVGVWGVCVIFHGLEPRSLKLLYVSGGWWGDMVWYQRMQRGLWYSG